MNRTALSLLVDVISLFRFLASTASGQVLWQILPGASYGFRGGLAAVSEQLFGGLSRQDWLILKNNASLLLAVPIVP